MLIPEEETVNTIVEKGTFYMPDIDNEPEEKSTFFPSFLFFQVDRSERPRAHHNVPYVP